MDEAMGIEDFVVMMLKLGTLRKVAGTWARHVH
jgi:hypothetical protein